MSYSEAHQLPPPREVNHSPRGVNHIRALDMDDVVFLILKHLLLPSVESLQCWNRYDCPQDQQTPYNLTRFQDDDHLYNVSRQLALFKVPYAPMLVCRRWYNVGRRVALSYAKLLPELWLLERPRFPDPLAHASQLHYIFPSSATPEELDEFARLLSHLGAANSTTPLESRPRLKELYLSDVPAAAGRLLSFSSFPQCNRITLLKASSTRHYSEHHIADWSFLLSAMTAPSSTSSRLPKLKHLLLEGGIINKVPEAWLSNPPVPLTTLSLYRVGLENFEDYPKLLFGVASPFLERLSVIGPQDMLWSVLTRDFFSQWAPLCPNLRWIQLDSRRGVEVMMRALVDYFPQAERLESNYCAFSGINCTMAVSHKLTRLEIASTGRDVGRTSLRMSKEIQNFLCSQAATQLQEVVIPGLLYHPQVLDPSLYQTGTTDSTPLWSCSTLSKLVLCIEARCVWYTDNSDGHLVDSRVVDGFIAASCPDLKSLDLRFKDTAFDFDPEGGLCFLGRLSKLEHLVIRANGCSPIDTQRPVRFSLKTWVSRLVDRQMALVPVLRWFAVEPTELDREQNLTNLGQCDYVLNTVIEEDLRKNSSYSVATCSQWRVRLQTMLTDDARNQTHEGSRWQQLKTFHVHLQSSVKSSDNPPSKTNKEAAAFIACFKETLQQVLPHVNVAIYPTFHAD